MTEKRFIWDGLCDSIEYGGEHFIYVYPKNGLKIVKKLNELNDKNKELQKRNDRQAESLRHLYSLVENKDWESLTAIIEEFKESDRLMKQEWGCYND